jgi:hypothetical protein
MIIISSLLSNHPWQIYKGEMSCREALSWKFKVRVGTGEHLSQMWWGGFSGELE